MTKRLPAKYKKYRRIGTHSYALSEEKWEKHIKRSTPGEHGIRFEEQWSTKKQDTEYERQLHEKQRLKLAYGNMTEQQFRHVYAIAARAGRIEQTLLPTLERRLQTIVCRAGFVKTFYSARQLINHGHVLIDGNKMRLANYLVKVGELVQITAKSLFESTLIRQPNLIPPSHLEVNLKLMAVTLIALPELEDQNVRLVRELYR